jgi:hypothetical protein
LHPLARHLPRRHFIEFQHLRLIKALGPRLTSPGAPRRVPLVNTDLSIWVVFFLVLIAFKTCFFLSYFQFCVLSSFSSLQDCEGLIVLNIGSYMGGVDLWQNDYEHDDDFSLQSMQDKMLEVVSVRGAWHLGKLQVCHFLKISSLISFTLYMRDSCKCLCSFSSKETSDFWAPENISVFIIYFAWNEAYSLFSLLWRSLGCNPLLIIFLRPHVRVGF